MNYTLETDTFSPEETISFAEKIGRILKNGDVIAFKGGLGAGKTAFTRGIAIGMGLPDEVSSPTFALVNEYIQGEKVLYHFDMYRITGEESLETTGFFDHIDGSAVVAAEWSENIEEFLPETAIIIEIVVTGEFSRHITITGDERFANPWN